MLPKKSISVNIRRENDTEQKGGGVFPRPTKTDARLYDNSQVVRVARLSPFLYWGNK